MHKDRKSVTGIALTMGKGVFYASSVKQKIVTKSSTEAELVATSDGMSYAIWALNFLKYMGYSVPFIKLWQDNKSAITMLKKGWSSADRTKHIDIKYFWLNEQIKNGIVQIEHLNTNDMLADVLTKPLANEKYKNFVFQLLNKQ
jgi:hypothetical protein